MSKPSRSPNFVERRERTFLVLAGVFLGAVVMLNLIGITRFIQIGPLALAVGVLPYPITFLCTDLISELYGKRRANFVVWVGLYLSLFVLFVVWLGQNIPAVPKAMQPPWQVIPLGGEVHLPDGTSVKDSVEFFQLIYATTTGAVLASMVAYMTAQFCDVALFHYFKKLTKGKHLWLRNNGSTVLSQLVDAFMVTSVTFGASVMRGDMSLSTMFTIMFGGYLFKLCAALLDTGPVYIAVHYLRPYLGLKKNQVAP